ncbi:16615_t:CDS:2, partial [Racocetra fulgida]
MDIVDQHIESDVLLDNIEVETIISNLPDESLYSAETVQAMLVYIQATDEPIAIEEILDDEGIISIVQAEEIDDKPTRQKIEEEGEDEVPEPLVIVAEENSESNLSLDELGFLRKLLKEYKHVFEKLKKQSKIISFFTFPDLYFNNSHLQDSYPYDLYSQDLYPHDLYSQDLYPQGSYSYNSNSPDLSLRDS